MLKAYGTRMLRRDFEPGFYVELFVKDLGIVLDECRRMKLAVPGTALAYQLYQAMLAQGKNKMGTEHYGVWDGCSASRSEPSHRSVRNPLGLRVFKVVSLASATLWEPAKGET